MASLGFRVGPAALWVRFAGCFLFVSSRVLRGIALRSSSLPCLLRVAGAHGALRLASAGAAGLGLLRAMRPVTRALFVGFGSQCNSKINIVPLVSAPLAPKELVSSDIGVDEDCKE